MEHYLIIASTDDTELDLLVSAELKEQAIEAWREYYDDFGAYDRNVVYTVHRLPPVRPSPYSHSLDDLTVIEHLRPKDRAAADRSVPVLTEYIEAAQTLTATETVIDWSKFAGGTAMMEAVKEFLDFAMNVSDHSSED